jgi:hypothetical protein
MSHKQYIEILKYITEDNTKTWPWTKQQIKYVRPNLDLRDYKIFRIEFQVTGGNVVFDFRDSETESIYDRIMNWLKEE